MYEIDSETTLFTDAGFGDIVPTAFFSPAQSGRIIWGVGPISLLPAATSNALGTEKFGVGSSIVALTQPGRWTVGVLFNHIWSTSGANDRPGVTPDVSATVHQLQHGNGVAVGVSYSLSLKAWAAFDTTWYRGGQGSVNDVATESRGSNSRIGATLVFPVSNRHAIKVGFSTGAVHPIRG